MQVEEWFKDRDLSEGEFGTYQWVAPADDPLSALAVQVSRDELAWRGGDNFCLACWASAEYLNDHPAADRIPEEYWRFCCRFAGRHVPKPGLWHEMLEAAYMDFGELDGDHPYPGWKDEVEFLAWAPRSREPEVAELTHRIEDAMRKVEMAERLQGIGTDTSVGDDGDCWNGLPLWSVKLGEVHPLTGGRREPWQRILRQPWQRRGHPRLYYNEWNY